MKTLDTTLAEFRAAYNATKSPKGSVFSNTDTANPIPTEVDTDELGKLLGFVDVEPPEDIATKAPSSRGGSFVWLTDACANSALGERFADKHKPELGGTLHPSTDIPTDWRQPCAAAAYGVDTLHLSVTMNTAPSVIQKLEELKGGNGVTIASGPFRWRLEPFGCAPHWQFVLSSAACTIKLRSRATYDANAFVEVRSAFLWSLGARAAVSVIADALRRWSLQKEGKLQGARHGGGWVAVEADSILIDVARVDLAADFVGDYFDGSELSQNRFITRSRRRTVYTTAKTEGGAELTPSHIKAARDALNRAEARGGDLAHARKDILAALGAGAETWGERLAEHVRGAAYVRGVTCTGFSFGAGAILCRMYRKDIEIKGGKTWFRQIWDGYEKGDKVWRVEFQVRTQGLNTFKLNGRTSRRWQHVADNLDGLWSHLTARTGKGWISFRDVGSDKKRERWEINEFWRRVQDVRWSSESSVSRDARSRITGSPKRIRTSAEMISAWCAGSIINHETGRRAAEVLAPQLAGIAAAYTAAVIVRDQGRDPDGIGETKTMIERAVREAISDRAKDKPERFATSISDAADRLVTRAIARGAAPS